MKKASHYIGIGLVIMLIVAAAFTFLTPRFGWRVNTVFSGSMEPAIKTGSMLVTRPVKAERIKVGDIIIFHSPVNEKLMTHRVIEVVEQSALQFQTKGDTNEDADPFILSAENIVGKAWFYIPGLGYITQFIKTPLGFMLTVLIPGLAVIVMEIRYIIHLLKEQETEKKYRILRRNTGQSKRG